jgi:hypothetical protein
LSELGLDKLGLAIALGVVLDQDLKGIVASTFGDEPTNRIGLLADMQIKVIILTEVIQE